MRFKSAGKCIIKPIQMAYVAVLPYKLRTCIYKTYFDDVTWSRFNSSSKIVTMIFLFHCSVCLPVLCLLTQLIQTTKYLRVTSMTSAVSSLEHVTAPQSFSCGDCTAIKYSVTSHTDQLYPDEDYGASSIRRL